MCLPQIRISFGIRVPTSSKLIKYERDPQIRNENENIQKDEKGTENPQANLQHQSPDHLLGLRIKYIFAQFHPSFKMSATCPWDLKDVRIRSVREMSREWYLLSTSLANLKKRCQ